MTTLFDLMNTRISETDPSKIIAEIAGATPAVSFLTADGARTVGHHLIELACEIDPPEPTSLGAPPNIKTLTAQPSKSDDSEIFLQDRTGSVAFCTAGQARAAAAVLIAAAEEVESYDVPVPIEDRPYRHVVNTEIPPQAFSKGGILSVDTSELKASIAKVYAALDATEPSDDDFCDDTRTEEEIQRAYAR